MLSLISLLLLSHLVNANDYSNPNPTTVTSAPIRISEQHSSGSYHRQGQLTQSYQVLPEPRNYYPYPQYLPSHAGYSNIQTVGQPYQMYGSSAPGARSEVSGGSSAGNLDGYGGYSSASSSTPIPTLVTERHRYTYSPPSPTPVPPSPFSELREKENQHIRAPASSNQGSGRSPVAPPFMIAPKPVLSYGAANPFLANLPPAQGVYGAPVDSSHRGYDGSSGGAPPAPPPASLSNDDTWEALEASLDANTRRRHRHNN